MLLFCAAHFHCVCDVLSCCEVVVKHGFVTTRAAFPFTRRDIMLGNGDIASVGVQDLNSIPGHE